MAASILINDLRGGRNGFDPPHSLPVDTCVEMLNVDLYGAMIARRRGGCAAVSLSGGTAPGTLSRLFRHQPSGDEGAAELWSFSQPSATVLAKRLAAGTTWADVTGGALITAGTLPAVETTTLDGRLWIAASSATGSRLMVYDPTAGNLAIRYSGFSTTYAADTVQFAIALGSTTVGPPTMADTGAGTYAAVNRTYRVRFLQLDGTRVIRRSEFGEWRAITPSGTGTAVRVTRPTAMSEGETHWEVEVSYAKLAGFGGTAAGPFYKIGTVVIATTTFDDSVTAIDAPTYPESADIGEYRPWPNVRYIISDGNRLIGAGSHKTGEKTSRIYFSYVLGATDQGDIERVPMNDVHENFLDLNENDGGAITGLAKSMNGAFYAFKRRQIWRCTPTGDDITPYLPRLLTSAYGAISQASVVAARDVYGNPAIYFWSEEGPCRMTVTGDGASTVQYLGEDIKDLTAQVTFAGFDQSYPFALYHLEKHQVWFYFNYRSGGSTYPVKAVFDIMRGTRLEGNYVRGGWTIHSDYTASVNALSHIATSGVMFGRTLAASMSADLVPYVGGVSTTLLRCDTTDTTDNSVNFQAYVRSRPLDVQPFGENVGIGVSSLLADPAADVTIRQSLIRDYGLETRTSTVNLTAAASETKVIRKFEDSETAGAGVVQVQLGDATAVAATQWKLHELALTVFPQEPR